MARFLLLCVGVTLLLACCLVAFVTAVGVGGIFVSGLGLWFFLGIPLAVALFIGGIVLCAAGVNEATARVAFTALMTAFIATLVAFIPGIIAGPQLYQQFYGEKTTATVTAITVINSENGGILKHQYFVRSDDGEDLGVLAHATDKAKGDRIEVVADPHGWVPPVAADQLSRPVPATILAACAIAIVLAALAVLGTALTSTVRRAHR